MGGISLVSTALPTLLKITFLVSVCWTLGLVLLSALEYQHNFQASQGNLLHQGENETSCDASLVT